MITSGKDTFGAGADLTMLEQQRQDYETLLKQKGEEAAATMVFERSRKLSQLYRRLETSGKPLVAALNGTAMGGCFELALACHHRVAADNPKTRLGLPEIKVGLFPGAGGTQRIARMMGTADALQFLLKGDQIRLDRAKTMKLVDNVVPAADLVKTAKDWIKTVAEVEAAVGRGRLQAAGRPGVVEDGHDDLAGRERALPQGDARQLSGGARDPLLRCSRACRCRSIPRCASSRATSPRSCARRKPPR